jgi:hypothetical protein
MSERVFLFRAGSIRDTIAMGGWFPHVVVGACLVLGVGIVLLGLLLGPNGGQVALPLWTVAALALPRALLIWHLSRCWRHRLYLCDEGIASQELLAQTEVNFADVVGVKWFSEGLGAAKVRTLESHLLVTLA